MKLFKMKSKFLSTEQINSTSYVVYIFFLITEIFHDFWIKTRKIRLLQHYGYDYDEKILNINDFFKILLKVNVSSIFPGLQLSKFIQAKNWRKRTFSKCSCRNLEKSVYYLYGAILHLNYINYIKIVKNTIEH